MGSVLLGCCQLQTTPVSSMIALKSPLLSKDGVVVLWFCLGIVYYRWISIVQWFYGLEQYSVYRFSMSQSSSVRRFPKWSWVVVPFPCFTVVESFLNWYAFLLSLFFMFFFKLTTLFSHPVSFCLFFALLDISLVTRWFESSQPQTITSGPNTNFTLSPSYSFHKSSYQKFLCMHEYLHLCMHLRRCLFV